MSSEQLKVDSMTELEPIKQAVRLATTLARRIHSDHFTAADKATDDPVTIADYGVQALICRALKQHFPADGVIAEEHGEQFTALLNETQRAKITTMLGDVLGVPVSEAEIVGWLEHGKTVRGARTWVIDPIDGTKGFIAGRHYAVGVGVLHDGDAVEAVVGTPGYPHVDPPGALFYTHDGAAYVEPLAGGAAQPLRVSDRADMQTIIHVESIESKHKDIERLKAFRALAGIDQSRVRELDSMEKYGWVAAGHADVYLRLPRGEKPRHYIWDHAAGVALVRAAGGTATDLDGSPLDFGQGSTLAANTGLLTSNGPLHDDLVDLLGRALAE